MLPRSPWEQSFADKENEGVPTDDRVADIFAAINPLFPTPHKTTFDWHFVIASKLARSYSDSHSLKTLIKEFINIDVSKQFQSSDFGGELSSAQLKYCANDVIYLHKIHEELDKILKREKRIGLYNDCLKFLKTRVDLDLALFKDDIWSH